MFLVLGMAVIFSFNSISELSQLNTITFDRNSQ